MDTKVNSGIYKITSPSGNMYIGQAVDLARRKADYKYLKCKNQQLLHRSIIKYGFESHVFEVLEYCDEAALHEKEMYYIAYYKTNRNKHRDGIGLNLTDGGQGSRGYKHTPEASLKMSLFQKSLKRTEESNLKRSLKLKGRKAPENLILKLKGVKKTEEHKRKMIEAHLIPVIDVNTKTIYSSIKEAALCNNYSYPTLKGWLNGAYKNKSSLIYLKDYERVYH